MCTPYKPASDWGHARRVLACKRAAACYAFHHCPLIPHAPLATLHLHAMSPMSTNQVTVTALGDRAWTLSWHSPIDLEVNSKVMAVNQTLIGLQQKGALLGVTDVVPAFCALTVFYDPLVANAQAIKSQLEACANTPAPATAATRHWHLPVCFEDHWAPDLPDLARHAKLDPESVCAALTQCTLRCHAMGFLPGFAYLATLPPALHMPRLATPRTLVPAQSLAVAGGMAAVYPADSPGGWRLVGHMPVPLFDVQDATSPALLRAGDDVTFYAVTAAECEAIARAVARDPSQRWIYAASPESGASA